MGQSGRELDSRPQLLGQCHKGLRRLPIKVDVENCFRIGKVVFLQIVVEARTGTAKVGDSSSCLVDRMIEEMTVTVSKRGGEVERIIRPSIVVVKVHRILHSPTHTRRNSGARQDDDFLGLARLDPLG